MSRKPQREYQETQVIALVDMELLNFPWQGLKI